MTLSTNVFYVVFFVILQLFIVGLALAGPAVPSNNPLLLTFIGSALALLFFTHWRSTSTFFFLAVLVPSVVVMLVRGPGLTISTAISVVVAAPTIPASLWWREVFVRERYCDRKVTAAAAAMAEAEQRRLECSLVSVLPKSIDLPFELLLSTLRRRISPTLL